MKDFRHGQDDASVGAGARCGAFGGGCVHPQHGIAVAFGCPVLPGLIARNACHRIGSIFWMSPLVSVVVVATGLVAAQQLDFPLGPVVVEGLAIGLATA